jgi:hypothetical protein
VARPKEPKERVARRVREFRKRQRILLKQQNVFIWGLKNYFQERGLTTEWALASSVYKSIEVVSLNITFEKFIQAIRGTKDIKPVKSIEVSTLMDAAGTRIFLIRPTHIPEKRRKK